jgi:hypothetical protein
MKFNGKVIYIAGPYRGRHAWEVETNIRKAEELALALWLKGYAGVCPHANNRFFNGAIHDEDVLEGCLEILRRCDGVLFVPGWEASEGAQVEWQEALGRRIPTYFSLEELP